jgi:multidrug efflux pump subunit AcrA (membrane-fusion protein)
VGADRRARDRHRRAAPGAGFELEVAAYPGTLFSGKVLAASDFIDPSTRTIKVRAWWPMPTGA